MNILADILLLKYLSNITKLILIPELNINIYIYFFFFCFLIHLVNFQNKIS